MVPFYMYIVKIPTGCLCKSTCILYISPWKTYGNLLFSPGLYIPTCSCIDLQYNVNTSFLFMDTRAGHSFIHLWCIIAQPLGRCPAWCPCRSFYKWFYVWYLPISFLATSSASYSHFRWHRKPRGYECLVLLCNDVDVWQMGGVISHLAILSY